MEAAQDLTRRQLLNWATTQRRKYIRGTLPESHRIALEAIPGWRWRQSRYTAAEWVLIAEERARNNDGLLEAPKWLEDNGFSGLARVMWQQPELFAHISQARAVKRAPSEWVPIAEERARNHGGILESPTWLEKNVSSGLAHAMRDHPELFAHIPQERISKRVVEWVPIAEERAQNNGGVLESFCWLRKNGLRSLRRALSKSTTLFAHIPREVRTADGQLSAIRGGGKKGAAIARRLGVKHEE
jgi:hypothetical protein